MRKLKLEPKRAVRVLAVVDYYLPGYKGGGPAVSVSRLASQIASDFESFIFTRDRDLREPAAYDSVEVGDWNERPEGWVYYAPPKEVNVAGLLKAIETVQPDVIYLNSYFSCLTRAALMLRLMGKTQGIAFILAPRGEFSEGALNLKALKKKAYIRAAEIARFHDDLLWQVSSELELKDVKRFVERKSHFFVLAPDLMDPTTFDSSNVAARAPKEPGKAEFAFISRISEKKNLLGAIEMLSKVRGDVSFHLYGPIEDEGYWSKCKTAIAALPPHIRVVYGGPVKPADVLPTLSKHHFFLFPTLGENFGHVIPEALSAGLPVLVSDRAPWGDLPDEGAGFSIPLENPTEWLQALQTCVDADAASYTAMANNAVDYVRNRRAKDSCPKRSGQMFLDALALQDADRTAKAA